MKTLLALLLLLAASANAEPWSNTDRALMVSYTALQVIDVLQTEKCLDMPTVCHEQNPLYGDHPTTETLILTKAAITGLVYWMADTTPEYRRPMLWIVNIVQGAVVANNYAIVQLGFPLKD